jgi:hypothetical protein
MKRTDKLTEVERVKQNWWDKAVNGEKPFFDGLSVEEKEKVKAAKLAEKAQETDYLSPEYK